MPSHPPGLKAKPKAQTHRWDHAKTTTERGYGWKHQQRRTRILRDDPLCRPCREAGRVTAAVELDHIVPKAEGGTDAETNLQPICGPCHQAKSAEEAARARGSKPPRRRPDIGDDGWPRST